MIVRAAAVQCDVVFGDPEANAANVRSICAGVAAESVQLAVFPECFLTGYCVDSREAAESISIPFSVGADHSLESGSPAIAECIQVAREFGIHLIVGFAGKEQAELRNCAALIEPSGRARVYRKSHLPFLGYDRFAVPGSHLPVFDTEIGKIGILICFDIRPPEAARCLALDGADIIALPTNWPDTVSIPPNLLSPARAVENKVFWISANRVGEEHGFVFHGLSGIFGVNGESLGRLGAEAGVIIGDLDLDQARNKEFITKPGVHETRIFATRQPEIYGAITRSLEK